MFRAMRVKCFGMRPALPLLALSLLCGAPKTLLAQTSFPGLEDVAREAVANARAYKGPTVPPPRAEPWPEGTRRLLASRRLPLAVHGRRGVVLPPGRVRRILEALETAREGLWAMGWPPPPPDGGLGGTVGFDLLLEPLARPPAQALAAGAVTASPLDSEVAWGRLDPLVPDDRLEACVVQAYAEAVLLGLDPAEARPWREATAAWLAWRLTGRPGCEDGVADAQRHPWRAWIPEHDGTASGEGAALLLELLDRTRGQGDGGFVRAAWDLTRQLSRTERARELQRSPRLWETLRAMEAARGPEGDRRFEDLMVTVAERRWLWTGPGSPLPEVPRPPLLWHASLRRLPVHGPPSPPVGPYGSVYGLVEVPVETPTQPTVKVWLRGEWGVRWSLLARRLNERGGMGAPVLATPRKVPRAFLRVEPIGPTRRILLVATNVPPGLPDPRLPQETVRAMRWALDAEPRPFTDGGDGDGGEAAAPRHPGAR